MPKPTTKTGKRPRRKLSKRRLFLISFISIVVVVFGVGCGVVFSIIAKTPPFDPSKLDNIQQSSIIYDKDGNQIGVIHATQNREVAKSSEIPQNLKQAFVDVEDVRFYHHFGIDLYGIARSFVNDLMGKKLEGGSTITVQLARNAFLTPQQTISRKIQEAYLAIQLERIYTKDEILTDYLNRIPFGEGAYGIKAAAKTYFGKSLNQLDMAEIAMLAGMPQAPSGYDPYVHPNAAKQRRAVVLGLLLEHGLITQAQYDKDKDEPFTYVNEMKQANKNPNAGPNINVSYKYPSFVNYVIHELESDGISQDAIYSGGLKIYTTVDSKIQSAAESAFADPKNFPPDKGGQPVQGAMVIMDPKDGSIRAMVGGRQENSVTDFNRAWQAYRQPGSSIKPLAVMAPALSKGGYFPGTVLDDEPVSFPGAGTNGSTWSPVDDDYSWRGLITMRHALRQSVNVYAIKLLDKIGVDYGWQFAKDKFGLPLTDKNKVLSLALGTPGIPLVDMVSAYQAFPTGGILPQKHAVVKVYDSKGNLIVNNTNPPKKRILTPQVAFLMNSMLRGVVNGGYGATGFRAQFGNWYVCGKTGTTSLYDNNSIPGSRDAWWIGYTPDYVGGVWMGFDNTTTTRNMYGEYGGNYPALLWKKIMEVAHENLPVISNINPPSGITTFTYDSKSGLAPSSLTPPQFIKHDYAIADALPKGMSNVWEKLNVCADTGLLPGPNTTTTVSKVFLNIKRSPNAPWPSDELPYKPPTKVCNMGSGSGKSNSPPTTAPPAQTTSPPQQQQTTNQSSTSPAVSISHVSAYYNNGIVDVNFNISGTANLTISIQGSSTTKSFSNVSSAPLTVPFTPSQPGNYTLTVTGTDSSGNTIQSQTTNFTVSGNGKHD